MDLAERLLRALTEPGFEVDPNSYDVARLSDEALGSLLPAAYRSGRSAPHPAMMVRFALEDAGKERQPRYTPDACRDMFDALVAQLPEREFADLTLGAGALVRCTGPVPELAAQAGKLVGFLLGEERPDHPYALLCVAGLAGPDARDAVMERLSRNAGAIAVDEFRVLAGLVPAEAALVADAEGDSSFTAPPPVPDLWERLAAVPAYAAFARRALDSAADRAQAIQAGTTPYRADKAFTTPEVTALGHAARLALHGDAPWLPELFDRLLPAISVAPTAAKTLPSQALLYELVRAAQDFPTPELVTGIRSVRKAVRHAGVPKQLDKMLKHVDAALAERTEVALRLPRLGFRDDGVLRREAAGCAAVLTVAETAVLTWEKEGRTVSGAPAALRREDPGLVKEARELAKRVDIQLGTLARALEGGFTADATHPYGWWRAELAAHPLARAVVGRLIWEVEVGPGQWQAVLPAAGELPDAPDEAPVRLWHPIRSDPGTVRAWRDLLVERRIRQPFKQAFREIYRLTRAEEETGSYSNRFAAHLVHYHRMFALFRARGWRSGRLGPWDSGGSDEAVRALAGGAWQVRFRHGLAGWEDGHELASTDQVRYRRRTDAGLREVPLADVPPLVFSESMRDVDLFVGVTSIAADPEWTDQGPERAYWERARFGELTENAEARRAALERLLPRLRIADRCSLDGRFLRVRGDLRTYKIHLGSGNILMEPDDAYLCVVPERRTKKGDAGRIFLPFEDDRLSLILSKAFLLAADTDITDDTILAQIKGGA